jgi:hypothetical protein
MPPNVGGVGAGMGMGVGVGVGVGGRSDAQAMLAQQNREMEALERRSQRERSGSMNPAQVRGIISKILSAVLIPPVIAVLFFFTRGKPSPRRGLMKKTPRKSSNIYRLGRSH